LREQNDVADGLAIRHYHHQTVYANPESCRWRHPVFESGDEILVNIALFPACDLFPETFPLFLWVIQFRICVGEFAPAHKKLEPLHDFRFVRLALCQGGEFNRIVGDKGREFTRQQFGKEPYDLVSAEFFVLQLDAGAF
jgi:hypothetical protein